MKHDFKKVKEKKEMKRQVLQKLLSCSLAAALILGTLAGCGSNGDAGQVASQSQQATGSAAAEPGQETAEPSQEAAAGITYPIDTDVTLTVVVVPDPTKSTSIFEDLQDSPWYQQLQERTGIKLEIQYAADTKAQELLLMSGDLPDMVWGAYAMLPGGAEVCIEDGIILPLNDYLNDYMPDYKALMEGNIEYRKIATTASGDIWGGICAGETYEMKQGGGVMVRQDWLDDLGMEAPRTAEQFYDMLVAFKEEKGAEVPFSTTLNNLKAYFLHHAITDAFGLVSTSFYHMDGEIHYGYAEAEVKQVFEFVHKLYVDGLLDPEFATLDAATEKSNILTGRSGCTHLLVGSVNGYRDSQENENYWLCGLSPMVQNEGDVARGGYGAGLSGNQAFVITTACEHPEIAAALLNYGYSEEGQLFYNFGEEGVCWKYDAEGQPAFTDLIMNNPDGWSYAQACATYTHGNYQGPHIQMERYYQQALSVDEHRLKAWERLAVTDWEKYCVSDGVQIPTELQDEYAKIESEVTTYIDEMIVAYITGAKSLDNFESEYMATLQSLKVDRMIEIKQIAYDEYRK